MLCHLSERVRFELYLDYIQKGILKKFYMEIKSLVIGNDWVSFLIFSRSLLNICIAMCDFSLTF